MLSGRARACGVVGVVALVAAGLVGCGGGESAGGPTLAAKPTISSTSSDAGGSDGGGASDGGGEASSRTANLPPENAALEAPDFKDYTGIKYETDQGAQETAKYFFDAMYYAYATGDLEPLLSVVNLDQCGACNRVVSEVQSWRTSGIYLAPVTLNSEDVWVSGNDGDVKKVQYVYSTGETQKFKSGSPMKDYPETQYAAGFHLKYGSKGWQVEGVAWKDANDVQD